MDVPNKIELIKHWLKLLDKERMYQQEAFKMLLEQTLLKERVKEGFTWHPVKLKSSGFAIGEIPYVEIENLNKELKGDHFQAGRPVQLFHLEGNQFEKPVKGIIHWLQKGNMKIYLHAPDVPSWIKSGKFGVDLLYDEQTFRDMHKAMDQLLKVHPTDPLFQFSEIFYGEALPSFHQEAQGYVNEGLNPSQNAAINRALSSQDISIIHGPPGTGKTTTLVHLIIELTNRGEKVLVCAPSNAAVDWVTNLLFEQQIDVLRIGHLSRIDKNVLDCSLESKVFSLPEAKDIKKLRIKAEEFRKLAGQYKRSFGTSERTQRRRLYNEARELSEWAKELENRLISHILEKTKVITCTLNGANNPYIKNKNFDTCIIDESAQALQGACWIAMSKANRIVLAGDPFQLPPTVKDPEAAKQGLSVTLLDIAIQKFPDIQLLNVQYRMNNIIMQFSNQWFYKGALKSHESVASHTLIHGLEGESVLEFIDTAGCGFHEQQLPDTMSYYNNDEYLIIREHLEPLLKQHQLEQPRIGILSPYKAQVKFINASFQNDPVLDLDLTIQTIDGFQGQERDVIYISLVRSNEDRQIGFLKDYRRMNVAMTRARKKLIIIGDSATLASDAYYRDMLAYMDSVNAYRSAWEFIQ